MREGAEIRLHLDALVVGVVPAQRVIKMPVDRGGGAAHIGLSDATAG